MKKDLEEMDKEDLHILYMLVVLVEDMEVEVALVQPDLIREALQLMLEVVELIESTGLLLIVILMG